MKLTKQLIRQTYKELQLNLTHQIKPRDENINLIIDFFLYGECCDKILSELFDVDIKDLY